MADVDSKIERTSAGSPRPARTEIGVTTGPIRGSRKIHVGPLKVAMRAMSLVSSRVLRASDDMKAPEECA